MKKNKKIVVELIIASIIAVAGIICCIAVTKPSLSLSKATISEIKASDDVVLENFYVIGSYGSTGSGDNTMTYFVIIATDENNAYYSVAVKAAPALTAEFEKLANGETFQKYSERLYGSLVALEGDAKTSYNNALESAELGIDFKTLDFCFADSQNSSSANGILGFLCLLPFWAVAGFMFFGCYKKLRDEGERE